jgi:hypothetical protein
VSKQPDADGIEHSGVSYSVCKVSIRKQHMLLRREGVTGTPVAYFRSADEAERFRAWFVQLAPARGAEAGK